MKLQNWVLELWSNYEIATDRFFHLRLPAPRLRRRPYAGAGHLAAPRVAPPPKTAPAPLGLPQTSSPGVPPSSTRAPVPLLLGTMLPWPSHTPRLAAPSPAAPTLVDRFPARPDPPPHHRAPIKRAIALPARAQEGRPCHCRRQARLRTTQTNWARVH